VVRHDSVCLVLEHTNHQFEGALGSRQRRFIGEFVESRGGHAHDATEGSAAVTPNRQNLALNPPLDRPSPQKEGSRMARRIALTVSFALALAVIPSALAGKGGGAKPPPPSGGGGGTSGGSISLVLLNSTDGLAHVGQKVTFKVSTTATQQPWVTVDCHQNGAWVYHASNGIFPTSLNQVFTLGSNTWLSGAADCTATLQNWDNYSKHGSITNLTSMSFHVSA
jgi:hypothetical protein